MSKELSIFKDKDAFEHSQRVAKMLSSSSLVPDDYRESGNGKGLANTMIALNLANRTGSDPLMVMQNLYIVHGKPGWSSQFVIASLNSCGRFDPLQFIVEGEGMNRSCRAVSKSKDGAILEGPTVTVAMAKAEGWLDKKGSKWATMPELMLRYRAASFFGKLYAPDILMGMQTAEELQDITLPASPSIRTLPEDVVTKMLAQVSRRPTQDEISALTDALTTQNVDPQQTIDILSRAQAIVDAAQVSDAPQEPIPFRVNETEEGQQ